MVFGVPLLTNRVAPRCTAADTLLLVTVDRNRVINSRSVPVGPQATGEFVDLLAKHTVAILVCGGISRETREIVQAHAIEVMENVACSAEEIVAALDAGVLRPGLGFGGNSRPGIGAARVISPEVAASPAETRRDRHQFDCLQCADRKCLRGEECRGLGQRYTQSPPDETRRIMEAASDVALEKERQLCRLSEVVYFCLEMEYERIGIAFCIELHEPADVLAGVLRRFFRVVPICCKIGGHSLTELKGISENTTTASIDSIIACNPLAQAEALNNAGTDLNIVVGLCIGADCVFTQASQAPVTTLFVKDKSLANNPIGAVYSEYYLRESATPDGPTVPAVPASQRVLSTKHEEAS